MVVVMLLFSHCMLKNLDDRSSENLIQQNVTMFSANYAFLLNTLFHVVTKE
jgi:hypothetical protein